jgi:hypothetical protein
MAAIEPWMDRLPPGVQPVMLTSWVLYYFAAPELARLRSTMDRLARERGLAWICGDLPALSARDAAPPQMPALPADEPLTSSTLWTLRWAAGGGISEQMLGWSHPHGRWVSWAGLQASIPAS